MYMDGNNKTKRIQQIMQCETVTKLNELTRNGGIRELIRMTEAHHENCFSEIADKIYNRNIQVVMVAGPSSSGKTTSAHRLLTQLRLRGKKPILISLDDYYIDRDKIIPADDGTIDFEHINTIDTNLFAQHLELLFHGRDIQLPTFNFCTGRREQKMKNVQLQPDSVLIVEGLHALNPRLITCGIAQVRIFKLYLCPALSVKIDEKTMIEPDCVRLFRRIVRDYKTRGTSVRRTIQMWQSVCQGEKRWIAPFRQNADDHFDSSTLYELAVLKKHVLPLLAGVEGEDARHETLNAVVNLLGFVKKADVDDEIPPTSLIREFIGGSTFYR